jgi:hypothetical protein
MEKKTIDGQVEPVVMPCTYCLRFSSKLTSIRLRINFRQWEARTNCVCPECLKYLKGRFKYA